MTDDALIKIMGKVAARTLPAPARMREIRVSAGLSEGDLAAMVGSSRMAVSHWEAGRRTPTGERAIALAAVLAHLAAS